MCPRISIVIPSFNKCTFINQAIDSILNQNYPNKEVIVIDGGSTDGSVDVIKRYSQYLAYWHSTPDRGQTHAVNLGLERATGDIMAFQNADDYYLPGAFVEAAAALSKPSCSMVFGDVLIVDGNSIEPRVRRFVRYSPLMLAEGTPFASQALFWRRGVQSTVGVFDEQFQMGLDTEFFVRVSRRFGCTHVRSVWGAYRVYNETKSAAQPDLGAEELAMIIRRHHPWLRHPLVKRGAKTASILLRTQRLLMQGDMEYLGLALRRRTGLLTR
jgi:glycosyltransferase involved in cell wall biosynthesis